MFKKPLFLLAFFLLAGAAHAQEKLRWRAALTGGGLSQRDVAGVTTGNVAVIGGEIGRALMDSLEVGYSFSYAGIISKYSLTGANVGYDATFHMLFLNVLQDRTDKGFYIGPQAGLLDRALRRPGQNVALNSGAIGARAGYNYLVMDRLSAGAQVQYLSVGSAETTVEENGANVTYKAPKTSFLKYLLMVSFKF
jgi:hypothetical protein